MRTILEIRKTRDFLSVCHALGRLSRRSYYGVGTAAPAGVAQQTDRQTDKQTDRRQYSNYGVLPYRDSSLHELLLYILYGGTRDTSPP
jgi:hypothetical protein